MQDVLPPEKEMTENIIYNEALPTDGSDDPDFVPMTFKGTLLFDGHLLPVTNMFDMYGDAERNPMRAWTCVCFIKGVKFTPGVVPADAGDWLAIACKPGEIAPVTTRASR
jgi:hypothetical protein